MSELRNIYITTKCTTDQLNAALNGINFEAAPDPSDGEVFSVTHVGGRDWVVIHRIMATEEKQLDAIEREVWSPKLKAKRSRG